MKKELPFAVALLATGCLLCFSQFTGPANSNDGSQSVLGQKIDSETREQTPTQQSLENRPIVASNQSLDFAESNDFEPVALASYQANVQEPTASQVEADKIPANSEIRSAASSPMDTVLYIHPESSPSAISFLAKLSQDVANSQPLGSSLEMTGNLFGQIVSAKGDYYQMGQGTYKSRIELSFGSGSNAPVVIQLCDGRFVYKLQNFGNQRTLEFVDLIKVRETAGERGNGITPTGWVASGGIASLFQHLASAFNFGELETGDNSDVVLRGSWADNALRQIAGVGIDGQPVEHQASRWNEIPPQLPHAVELVFRQDANLSYFPKRIKFLKFSGSSESSELKPMVVIDFSPPQPLPNISDRHFVVDSTDLDIVDLTEHYIARIEDFDQLQQTAEAAETIDR